MIGMIIFYLITTTLILLIGLIVGKQRRFQKDNLDKAALNGYDNAYDDGYKKGFAAGEKQGFNDGKLFSEIAAHNEKVLRKQGIIK